MSRIRKESLDQLKTRINLVDLLQGYMELKPSGSSYKGLCPFHDEKSPSFVVQRGDSHYHCFGCGAHGDAIAFLMEHQKLSFVDSVEALAEKFGVFLEYAEENERKGPPIAKLKEAMQAACKYYHQKLFEDLGKDPLAYLEKRDLTPPFLKNFSIGFAPEKSDFLRVMKEKGFSYELLTLCGLARVDTYGRTREFFSDRILFPIHAPNGAVIGFSGRKFKEETYGGKYVNTPETPLFKKSRVLFGLNYSRRTIAKRREALIVEGQVDALRLIDIGFDWTVASQGTAFGFGQVEELKRLGVQKVLLALDGDAAGVKAAVSMGNLFQKVGIEVEIVPIKNGQDPDSILTEEGKEHFSELLEQGIDYLSFMIRVKGRELHAKTPAGKKQLVEVLATQIRSWDDEVMIYESLKKLATLTQLPEAMVGVGQRHTPNLYLRKSESVGLFSINPDQVLESDCLRWLIVPHAAFLDCLKLARLNLMQEHFHTPICLSIFQFFLKWKGEYPPELLTLSREIGEEGQVFLTSLLKKKINRDQAVEQMGDSIQRLLEREWMNQRERVHLQMNQENLSDEEELSFALAFDKLKNNPPVVKTMETAE